MNPILEQILKDTYSLFQLKHRIRILKMKLAAKLYGSSQPLDLESEDQKWLDSLDQTIINGINQANFDQNFNQINQAIQTLKPPILYLTFDPPTEVLNQIGSYLRKNFPNHKLFDLKIDKNLIAGCAISFNGVYKDYSLRSKIDQNKQQILDSFKKFLQ